MALDRVKDTAFSHAVSDVFGDLADLIQKEVRLARAEISAKISTKLQAGVWMSAAAGLGLIAIFAGVQALIFGIASFGLAMHWACLIVAGAFALLALIAFFKGRANAAEELTPTRTIQNIRRDITTAKEQLT
jgi:hypothetical protein